MNIKDDLKYTKSHEWVEVLPNGNIRVGITDYAQGALGDLVFVELPEKGDGFQASDSFAVVESVKAVSDVYVPVDGVVAEVNEILLDAPEAINEDAYAAWLVELTEVDSDFSDLLDGAAYAVLLEEEG